MKKGNDTIRFEDRSEIADVRNMVGTYFKEHPNEKRDTLERFAKLLNIMDMEW